MQDAMEAFPKDVTKVMGAVETYDSGTSSECFPIGVNFTFLFLVRGMVCGAKNVARGSRITIHWAIFRVPATWRKAKSHYGH